MSYNALFEQFKKLKPISVKFLAQGRGQWLVPVMTILKVYHKRREITGAAGRLLYSQESLCCMK